MKPADRDIYLFDLRGFLHLPSALSMGEVADLNACLDEIPPLDHEQWYGYIQAHRHGDCSGCSLQQIYEAGTPFENLIDHPSWIDRVKHFVGGEGTFDWHHGPLFIDENFASIRGPGEAINLHSGGHHGIARCQFRVFNGHFHCGQINILIALDDIGPGDGSTMLIPSSHKANFAHPHYDEFSMAQGGSVDGLENAIEIHMQAGDALLFVDALSHGSARRTSLGQRRAVVYRYGPSWGNFRYGYQPSPALLERLTPERRQIVQPLQLLSRKPNKKSD